METREVTIEGTLPDIRSYGEHGRAVKVKTDSGVVEVSTSDQHVDALVAAINKLSGSKLGIPAEKTQYGLKVDKDFRFPGDPRKPAGDGSNFKNKSGKGGWETAEEREFKSASIVAQVAAKIVAEAHGLANSDREFTEKVIMVASAINSATAVVRLNQKYPVKPSVGGAEAATGPVNGGPPTPPASTDTASTPDRIQQLIAIGGDTLAVARAKRLLREKSGSDDINALDATAWGAFVTYFAEQEKVGVH